MEKKDGEGAIHLQDLLCCVRSRKLAAPRLPSRLFPASCAPASRWSHYPYCPRPGLRTKGVFGTNLYSGFLGPTASALMGTLSVKWGPECQGVAKHGRGGGGLPARPPLAGTLPVPSSVYSPWWDSVRLLFCPTLTTCTSELLVLRVRAACCHLNNYWTQSIQMIRCF